ncbi:MAG: hypothetical protein Q7I94_03115, partial [Candidatus Contubernalis sp.]|nr:hypothetical protein [Candidatus Contubernalis sp.]
HTFQYTNIFLLIFRQRKMRLMQLIAVKYYKLKKKQEILLRIMPGAKIKLSLKLLFYSDNLSIYI